MRIIYTLVVLLVFYWTAIFFLQRKLVFPAPPPDTIASYPADAKIVRLTSPAGITEAIYLPPLTPATAPAPVILFAHGNAELIDHWPAEFDEPRRWGVAVLLVEYPGYGRSGGHPSIGTIRQVFEAAYDWAAKQPQLDARRIHGYGRSLGGGAICELSRSRPLAALILESTFTDTARFARQFLTPSFLVRDRFDNLEVVARFQGPMLILHGDRDDIIPTVNGRELAAAAHTELHLLHCGHNDCPRSWDVFKTFLVKSRLLP